VYSGINGVHQPGRQHSKGRQRALWVVGAQTKRPSMKRFAYLYRKIDNEKNLRSDFLGGGVLMMGKPGEKANDLARGESQVPPWSK